MGWPSKLTDRELKRDSLLISCTIVCVCVRYCCEIIDQQKLKLFEKKIV